MAFIHENTRIYTNKGLLPPSKIKSGNLVAALDRGGVMRFVKPIIREEQSNSLYYVVKTEHADFYIAADGLFFYSGIIDNRRAMTGHDISLLLNNSVIKIPVVPNPQLDSGINSSDGSIVLYYLSKLYNTWVTENNYSVILAFDKRQRAFLADFANNYLKTTSIDWYIRRERKSKGEMFFFLSRPNDLNVLDWRVVDSANSKQAKLMIETSMILDYRRNKNNSSNELYHSRVDNADLIPLLALKAGFTVRRIQNDEYASGMFSSSKNKNITTKIINVTIGQNEINDVFIGIPEDYIGYIAETNGYTFILPNSKDVF